MYISLDISSDTQIAVGRASFMWKLAMPSCFVQHAWNICSCECGADSIVKQVRINRCVKQVRINWCVKQVRINWCDPFSGETKLYQRYSHGLGNLYWYVCQIVGKWLSNFHHFLQNFKTYSYIKSRRHAPFLESVSVKNSTCFGQIHCPSPGVSTLYTTIGIRHSGYVDCPSWPR